jgi:hypothetical protein
MPFLSSFIFLFLQLPLGILLMVMYQLLVVVILAGVKERESLSELLVLPGNSFFLMLINQLITFMKSTLLTNSSKQRNSVTKRKYILFSLFMSRYNPCFICSNHRSFRTHQ